MSRPKEEYSSRFEDTPVPPKERYELVPRIHIRRSPLLSLFHALTGKNECGAFVRRQ